MTHTDTGALEWLISGRATVKMLDFLAIGRDFDYSETDIADKVGISKQTVFREIPKLESAGLVVLTRRVGRAKMFRLHPDSDTARLLEQFAFKIAEARNENALKGEKVQERIDDESVLIEVKQERSA